ncbi:MAG: hypothetical protein K8H88_25855 [Sandaracinaceae bacterium]|nr:hypothetical protein [Sandaracinaceae bacterium]
MSDPYRGEERILAVQRDLFRWKGPKAGFTLFDTVVGTLVITSRRVLFLSTGEGGLTGQLSILANLVTGQELGEPDLRALANAGSVDLPLTRVRSLELKRRWDFASYLSLIGTSEDGRELAFAFMSKIGLNRSELAAVAEAAERARAQA